MSNENITGQIAAFMAKSFDGAEIELDQNIFETGFGNSLFAMQLVSFIELTFDIEVDAEDLEIENFSTIRRVAELVTRKQLTLAG